MKIFQKAVLLSLLIMIVKTMAVANQTVAIYDTMKVSKTVGSGQSMSVTVQTPGESNQTITPELIGQGTDGSREYEITYVPTAPVVYTFVLDIYGGGGGSEEYFTLTGTNTTPTSTTIANVTSPMNTTVTKTFTVGDAETDDVTTLTVGATWAATGVGSGSVAVTGANAKKTINFTPAVPNKVYTITYTVSDGFATRTRSFTITTTNTAPTLSQIADISAPINSTVTKSFTVSDAEIGSVSAITDTAYWSNGDIPISGTGETRSLSFTPTVPGTYTITYAVSDGYETTTKSFTVTATNTAPTLSQIDNSVIPTDFVITENFTVRDAEIGDISEITDTAYWSDGENGGDVPITGTGATRELVFIPLAKNIVYTITYAVSDGYIESVKTFTVTTANTAAYFSSSPNVTATEDEFYTFAVEVYDPDNDPIDVSLGSSIPDWLSSNLTLPATVGSGDTIKFYGTPTNDDVGITKIKIYITDGDGSITEENYSITIANVNDAPMFISTPTSEISAYSLYTYSITAEDVDNATLQYSTKEVLPEWLTLDTNDPDNVKLTGTPAQSDSGTYAITLQVSDDDTTVEQSFDITVTPINYERRVDSLALVAIWDSLGQPNGWSWTNWGSDISLDTWRNVKLNGDGRVTHLELGYASVSQGFGGPIAPEILTLTELDSLTIRAEITGSLPDQFDTLLKLKYLVIENGDATLFDIDTLSFRRLEHFYLSSYIGTDIPVNFSNSPELLKVNISSSPNLTEIPPTLQSCSKLTRLTIGNIPVPEVPEWVTTLTELTGLRISNAQISTLPQSLENLTKMDDLDFAYNNIDSFTIDVSKMPLLTEVTLDGNNLTAIPEVLKEHPNLKELNFEGNAILEVPGWVFELDSINEIEIDTNLITALPIEVLTTTLMGNLALMFNNNAITELPEGLCAGGTEETTPHIFYFRNNRLTHLPASFDSLDHIPHRFDFTGNRLHFDDIERMKKIYDTYGSSYDDVITDFEDQRDVTEKDTLWVGLGDTSSLVAEIRGTQDKIHYKWLKNGIAVTADSSNSYDSLKLETISYDDSGYYYFEATSDSVNMTILSDTFFVNVIEHSGRRNDSLALLAIWDTLGQPNWTNWGTSEPLQYWSGINLENDRVVEWNDFQQSTVTGPLAPEVGLLTALELLYIRNVNFTSLPKEMENMESLETIYFQYNSPITFPSDSLVLPALRIITIRNTELTELAIALDKSPHLNRVVMQDMDMDSIPEMLRYCDSLTRLTILNTGLSNLQEWIGELTQLERLSLYDNELREIPASFANLINLTSFDFDGNQLSEFNFDLQSFHQLDYFYLSGNLFTEVPEGIKSAPALTSIYMYENLLTSVPNWLFTNKYEEIEFYDNQITALPDSIIYVDSFFYADFSDNLIETVPEGFGLHTEYIDELYFDDNRIKKIPESIGALSSISGLSFNGNGIHFDEMEKLVEVLGDANAVKSVFSGQENVGDQDTLWVSEGDTISVQHSVRGTRSKMNYKWLKNSYTLSSSYDMDSSYGINGVTMADTGFYTVDIRNDSIASLSLRSDTIWVKAHTAPVITSDTVVTATEDIYFKYTASATDDFQTVTFRSENLPSWLSIDGDSIVGTPLNGTVDTNFTLIASDGYLEDSLVVTVNVAAVNDAPILTTATAQTTAEDTPLTVTLNMTNASDVDNALSETGIILGAGENYTVVGQTITPTANFTGTLTVPVTITDGLLNSATVNMTVTVTPVNDAPILTTASAQTTAEDTPLTLTTVMTNAIEPDGDALTLIVGAGANYTMSGTTITPAANFYGALTVPVAVTDGVLNSATVNMTVTVTPVNDAPVLTAATAQVTKQETPLTVTLAMTNATDVDGDALTLIVGTGANYVVEGTTVTPLAGFVGTLTVPVAITDGALISETVHMTITVVPTVAIEEADEKATGIGAFAVAPNIITDESEAHFVIGEELSGEGRIYVLDHLGDVIDEQDVSVEDGGHFYWDLTNSSGYVVTSGMYLVVLELDGKIYQRRIGIKR